MRKVPEAPAGWPRKIHLERQLQNERLSEDEKVAQRQALQQQERDYVRLQRQRLSVEDFEHLKMIGRGAFGEVRALAVAALACRPTRCAKQCSPLTSRGQPSLTPCTPSIAGSCPQELRAEAWQRLQHCNWPCKSMVVMC